MYSWLKKIIIVVLVMVFLLQIVPNRTKIIEKLSSLTNFYQSYREDSMEVIQNICSAGDKII